MKDFAICTEARFAVASRRYRVECTVESHALTLVGLLMFASLAAQSFGAGGSGHWCRARQRAHATRIIGALEALGASGRGQVRHAAAHARSALQRLPLFRERAELLLGRAFPRLRQLVQPGHGVSPTWGACEGLGAETACRRRRAVARGRYRRHEVGASPVHSQINRSRSAGCAAVAILTCKESRLGLPCVYIRSDVRRSARRLYGSLDGDTLE